MSVFKRPKKNDLFATKRACFQDGRLSNAARGLLGMMLSMPSDWDFYQNQIVSSCMKDGDTAIQSQMKELVMHGYLIKYPRSRIEGGRWGKIEYEIYDEPQISDSLSKESISKIFSRRFNYNDFKIIYPKRDCPVQAEPVQMNQGLQTNKELSSSKKETTTQDKAKPSLKEESVVVSFKEKNLMRADLSGEQRAKLLKRFKDLDDEVFKQAVDAYLAYGKENPIASSMATMTTALGGKTGKPWKVKVDRKAEQEKRRRNEEDSKFEKRLLIKAMEKEYNQKKYRDEMTGGPIEINSNSSDFFEYKFSGHPTRTRVMYSDDSFNQEYNNILRKLKTITQGM